MKRSFILILLLLLIFSLSSAYSQEKATAAILEYYDDSYEIEIFNENGESIRDIYIGYELNTGDTIKTYQSTAELKLVPNGSIVRIDTQTVFTIEGLESGETPENNFALLQGKMRMVAARTDNGRSRYTVRTPATVCGVRGTDFTQQVVPGIRNIAACRKGELEFRDRETGKSVTLTPGYAADIHEESFSPFFLSPEQSFELFDAMSFTALNPADVPGSVSETEQPAEEPEEETAQTSTVKETPEAEVSEVPDTAVPEGAEEIAPAESREESEGEEHEDAVQAKTGSKAEESVISFFGSFLGIELGSMSVNGRTYGKVVFQPFFSVGKFSMAFYLPIIYHTDFLDRGDWYKPQGNDEWSFGTDQTEDSEIAYDVLRDIALKIRYIRFGDRSDPFYLKAGNLSDMNIGHGILMFHYANDHDFPAIRRIGINTGFDVTAVGAEAVVNDLADPEIMGGRFFVRPFGSAFPMAIGLSSIIDVSPADSLPPDPITGTVNTYGDPLLLHAALDMDLPIVRSDLLSLTLFGDIAGLLPYFRSTYSEPDYTVPIPSGWALHTLYNPLASGSPLEKFNNYGFMTGLFGNLLFIDYRFDFRYSEGVFRNAVFNGTYNRTRGEYVRRIASFLGDPFSPEFDARNMGVYGSLGFNIMDKVYLNVGYLWPWEISNGKPRGSDDDYFELQFGIRKGVIPVVGIYGSISYVRTQFASTIAGKEGVTLFDANSVVKGELVFPITDILGIAVVGTTNTVYNERGTVSADKNNPLMQKVNPSISIQTRINY